jgi:hypothetical protein
MRDSPANTKDLLDSRSVVYYALILTFLFRQRRLIPLPMSLLQHTPGPVFVQCLVIHTGAVGEEERAKEKKRASGGMLGALLCLDGHHEQESAGQKKPRRPIPGRHRSSCGGWYTKSGHITLVHEQLAQTCSTCTFRSSSVRISCGLALSKTSALRPIFRVEEVMHRETR